MYNVSWYPYKIELHYCVPHCGGFRSIHFIGMILHEEFRRDPEAAGVFVNANVHVYGDIKPPPPDECATAFSIAQQRTAGSLNPFLLAAGLRDRKSTRLNSSHLGISYAVFCLK